MSVPRLRAPTEHGQILALPPLDQAGALLDENHLTLKSVRISSLGKSLEEIRALARREILAASAQYHQEAGEPVPAEAPSPPEGEGRDLWLVAGHQPELFHPGVWFKNFALYQLARKQGATALNLIVDTDAAKPPILHAPGDGRLARLPFDRSSLDTPYEERTVGDEAAFANLPERMASIASRWNFEPMLASFWRDVIQHAQRTPLLGERLAAARRTVERRWGYAPREVPMSRVCQTEAFAWFACSILARLPEFHDLHNRVVRAHRREHGMRSRSHPVPDLAADGAWLEAPFWAWRRDVARRGKLLVRKTPDAWLLRVGAEDWPALPCQNAIAAWRALEAQGFKIRARALTTTMFARLCLADLFLHGIGGAIYDELTDRIMHRFFAIKPPAFLILSATLLLPLPRFPEAARHARELQKRSRDLVYKPELFVERGVQTEPLIRAKQEWIQREAATHQERFERFERIRAINARLLTHVVPEMERVRSSQEECRREAEWDAVATRRDYAFCLYPEEMLRRFFQAEFLE